jgi:uncharacterized membrane protein
MALDHTSGQVARVHFSEVWGNDFAGYPDFGWWFTRFVSHLCAPGFFFLMGMSMMLFAQKRLSQNWESKQIRKYFLKRGGFILLMMFFLEFPAWGIGGLFNGIESEGGMPFPGFYEGGFFLPSTVLYGLAASMLVGSLLWKLNKEWLIVITVTSFSFSGFMINQSSPTDVFNPIAVFLYLPGITVGAMAIYPLIPWIGVTTFGMFWAKLMQERPKQIYTISLFTGLIFIVAFVILRFLSIGNFHFTANDNWISFFTLVKYPPSVAYVLITCGINLVLFYIFSKLVDISWLRPLRLFGQTAMFFYIVHLYLYGLIGGFFPLGCSLGILYIIWAIGLVPLYYICRWFLAFKKSKPNDSLWKMV